MLSLHGHAEQKKQKKKKLERVFQISQSNTMTEKKGPQRNNKKTKKKTRTNAVRIKETPLVIANEEEINKRGTKES